MDNPSPQSPQDDHKKILKYALIVGALVVLVAVGFMAFVLRSDKKTTTPPDYKPVSAVVGTNIPVSIQSDGVSVYFEHNGERLSLANRITDLMVGTEYTFTFTNNSGVKQGIFIPALKESIVVETGQAGTIYIRFTNPGTYYFMGNVYQPGWDGLRSGFDVGMDTIEPPPITASAGTNTPTPTPSPGAGGAFTSCADVTEIPQSECQALVDLYNSTNGPGWTNNTGWLQTNTPCSWHNVSCDSATPRRVTDISLSSNNLIGTIPNSIVTLNLQRLLLSANTISGAIPTNIGNMSSLIHLYLNDNQITGEIPASIGDLKELQNLTLKGNLLSGTIPTELGNLGNLLNLGLDFNQLSGDVPNSFGQLVNLRTLHLSTNQLTGVIPSTLRNLTLISGANASFGYNTFTGVEDTLVCPWLITHAGEWYSTQNPPIVNDPCQEIAAQPVAAETADIGKPTTMPAANQNIFMQIVTFFQELLRKAFGKK